MENRAKIWSELNEISPIVAEIKGGNVYHVPEGYFENLALEIIKRIQAEKADPLNPGPPELGALSGIISKTDLRVPFQVPDGYFETFSEKLINKIKASETSPFVDDADQTSPLLLSAGKQTSFSIPQGYFEHFAEQLMRRIKAEQANSVSQELEILSPILSTLSKKPPFSMPEDYFARLSDNILTGAQAVEFVNEELENLSGVMNGLKDINVFQTPVGYFENFSTEVLNKIQSQPQEAKVISIRKTKSWLRYAAAAAVIGVIATSALFIFNNTSKISGYAKIDDKQLVDSLKNANDEDILSYMQSHNVPLVDTSNSIASLDLNDNDADDMLTDVSDNELQQYVDEHYGTKELNTN
ncbi:MAG TPA: hypothetical protein VNV85_07500 [Puia sp.]|nr:hypothetical protein [Puia sp.]